MQNHPSSITDHTPGTGLDVTEEYASIGEKKVAYLTRFAPGMILNMTLAKEILAYG